MATFNDIEDIRGSKLNPSKLRALGKSIVPNYDYENATYVLISNRVSALCNESKLKGAALDGFKYQMSTYKAVLDGLCYANELDKYDISIVNSDLDAKLGDDILDGTEILDNKKAAEDALATHTEKKEYWEGELNRCEWWDIYNQARCRWNISDYNRKIEKDKDNIAYWKGRAELFVEINNELKDLFQNGFEFREATKEGIKVLKTAFDQDTNTYIVGDDSWKDKMNGMLESSVIDENGKVNLDLVEQILAKDADAISDTEYQILAYAYENIDVEQMDDFFMLFEVPEDIDSAKWAYKFNNDNMSTLQMGTCREFTVDSSKIDRMCEQLDCCQNNMLAIVEYGDISDEEKKILNEKRDDILQRITLAQTIDSINEFYGKIDENVFSFSKNETSGAITLDYQQYVSGNGDFYSILLEDHKVTVSTTLDERALNTHAITSMEDASLRQLTNYSSTSIVAENVTNEFMGAAFDVTGKAGGIAMFGLGLCKDIYDNDNNREYIEATFDELKVGNLADYYECVGNVVEYDDI